MNNRVVLDTNVIISAAISSLGNPAKIVELVSDGIITMYYSNEILSEYEEVLSSAYICSIITHIGFNK